MTIADNLARVREEMAEACGHAGRQAADVSLMAVSKVHPVEALLEGVRRRVSGSSARIVCRSGRQSRLRRPVCRTSKCT